MISIGSMVVLILFTGMVPLAFAQSDDVGSVLDKAQKSLTQESESSIAPTLLEDDYKSYENLDYNVSMQYPKDWSFEETGYDEIFPNRFFHVIFNSPVESDIVLFSITLEDLKPSSTTLNQYKDRITNNVKNNPYAKDISLSDSTLDGKTAYRLEYTSSIQGSVSKGIDVTSVNNGILQEVSVFGYQSAIDKYTEEISKMTQSVKFGEPTARPTPELVSSINSNSPEGNPEKSTVTWKTYVNSNCGLSIKYPSNWQAEEVSWDNADVKVINFIVEIQPDNSEGFNNVVSIELDDISTLSDSSFGGVRQFDEEYITMGVGTIISSVTSRVAGFPAQKITYTEPGVGDDEFKKMEVNILAYDREYKIIYDTSNEKYYGKYLSTFQKMLNTFTVSKPNFEGIHC